MRRHVWRLAVAVPALLAVAMAGCYQASSGANGAAPVSQPSATSAAPADEAATTVPAKAITAAKLADGTKAVVLTVKGMH